MEKEKTAAERAAELTADERQKVKSLYRIAVIVEALILVAMIVFIVLFFVQRGQLQDYYDRWSALSDKQAEVEQITFSGMPTGSESQAELESRAKELERAQKLLKEVEEEHDALMESTPVDTEGKSASDIRMALLDKQAELPKQTIIRMGACAGAMILFFVIFKAANPLFSESLYKEVKKLEKTS